jgi:hypothetical protein
MSNPLDMLLDEVRCHPKYRPGKTGHDVTEIEKMFAVRETRDHLVAIEACDRCCKIARRKSVPLPQRMLAMYDYLRGPVTMRRGAPMNAIDALLAEARAAGGGSSELERLKEVLRVLQLDDSPAAVANYDDLMEIAARKLPLLERLHLMLRRMTEGPTS